MPWIPVSAVRTIVARTRSVHELMWMTGAVGLLSAVACGIVGSYVTVRRITYIAGAIAHSVLGGMGAALYLQRNLGWEFLSPIHGAVFAALLSAIIIGMKNGETRWPPLAWAW